MSGVVRAGRVGAGRRAHGPGDVVGLRVYGMLDQALGWAVWYWAMWAASASMAYGFVSAAWVLRALRHPAVRAPDRRVVRAARLGLDVGVAAHGVLLGPGSHRRWAACCSSRHPRAWSWFTGWLASSVTSRAADVWVGAEAAGHVGLELRRGLAGHGGGVRGLHLGLCGLGRCRGLRGVGGHAGCWILRALPALLYGGGLGFSVCGTALGQGALLGLEQAHGSA